MMKRRAFITFLGGAAVAWPLAVHAAGKRPHVAVLTLLSPQDERGRIAAFVAGMSELGYVAGQTFAVLACERANVKDHLSKRGVAKLGDDIRKDQRDRGADNLAGSVFEHGG